MWTVFGLFVLWILSMYFYLPLPVIVILFAALASGTSVTIWYALLERRGRRAEAVIERNTNS